MVTNPDPSNNLPPYVDPPPMKEPDLEAGEDDEPGTAVGAAPSGGRKSKLPKAGTKTKTAGPISESKIFADLREQIIANIAGLREQIASANANDGQKKVFEDALAIEVEALKSLSETQRKAFDLDSKTTDAVVLSEPKAAIEYGEKDFRSLFAAEFQKATEKAQEKAKNDCYYFIGNGPCGNKFAFTLGLGVFLFQTGLLTLMLFSRVWKKMSENLGVDNPDQNVDLFAAFVPANASFIVRITQLLSVLAFFLFGGESVDDLHESVVKWSRKPSKAHGYWPHISNALRCIQALFACVTAMMLVLTSTDPIDIVLNFTAVHFISTFDNKAYELATEGFYGAALKDAANREENETFVDNRDGPEEAFKEERAVPDEDKKADHKQRLANKFVGLVTCVFVAVLIALWVIGDKDSKWTTQIVRVEFDMKSGLHKYSGCYTFNGQTHDRRLVYESDATLRGSRDFGGDLFAKIEYCKTQRQWYFHENRDDLTSVCKVGDDELAHSSKTLAFDISSAFESSWVTPDNKPVNLYFSSNEMNRKEPSDLNCGSFGNDGVCDEGLNFKKYRFDDGDCCNTLCSASTSEQECNGKTIQEILAPMWNVRYRTSNGDGYYTHNESDVDKATTWFTCKEDVLNFEDFFNITGTIPSNIGFFKEVKKFALLDNELMTGSIPPQIGKMTALKTLYLEKTPLTGTIPREIGELKNVNSFSLWGSVISGTIPTEMGELSALYDLWLPFNKLTGTIPTEIGKLTKLVVLDLEDNNLTGTIPSEIGLLTDLEELYFFENSLTGEIPCEVQGLIDWNGLDVAFEQSDGTELDFAECF